MVWLLRSISSMRLGSFMGPSTPEFDELLILLDSFPSPDRGRRPAHAVHVEPLSGWLILYRFGTHPQNVPVRVFHLDLQSPRIVCRLMPNVRTRRPQLLHQFLHFRCA